MQMVTRETMVAVMVHCCGSTSASVMRIATLLQMTSPALLWLAGSGAAARKGRSRVRHFAMGFTSTVVNAALLMLIECVSVAPHGCVLCTWLCGIHCVPRRGATALLGMQHGTSAHDNGSNGCSGRVGAAGNGLWWSSIRLSSVALCYLSPVPRSVSHPIPSATICLTVTRACACALLALQLYGAACWAGLLRVHVSAVQRWSICAENG